MRKFVLLILALVILGVGFAVANQLIGQGGRSNRPSHVQITTPVANGNGVSLRSHDLAVPPTGDPIAVALNGLMATADDKKSASAIPDGTRLLSVKVDKGLATVNLSEDFARLNRMGDTGESLAYNALRRALAQFPQVDRMTVQVEGKTYEGEHSGEWLDIPVRDDKSQARGSE